MSHDISLFFPHAEFPAQAWYDVLGGLRSDDCDVSFDDDAAAAEHGGIKECSLAADGTLISVSVYSFAREPSECAPAGTHWRATVSTGMGRSGLAWWLQHAIPYHALVYFPGVTVHDWQYHVGRSVADSSWASPESWLAFSEKRLWRMGPKQALVDHGLFHPDGRLRF